EERVVEAGYRVAFVDTGVLANPGTRCPSERRDRPRRREPPTEGVLGVDSALERGAAPLDVVLGAPEWLTARDPELLAHEVDARDQLGHGVLDLKACVHLEEIGVPLRVHEELHGAGADITRRPRDPARGLPHALAHGGVHAGRRALLDALLVAPLDRALALPEADHAAGGA